MPIHPTAVVDSSARVAATAHIGPWCVVGADVTLGDDTVLHSHVVVERQTHIGRGNEVFPFAYLGGTPQDKKFRGESTTCEIGDNNQIREHVTMHRGTSNGGGVTRLGNDNLIMGNVHIAHDCMIGNGCVIANNSMLAGHAVVHDFANVGGGAGIHHFVVIGTCAFVGAMARVSKDVPPFMIVEGNPAEVRGHNHIALSRRGFTEEDIEAMKEAYKRLFREKGGDLTEKVRGLMTQYAGSRSVEILCAAVTATASGVHGRALEGQRTDDRKAAR
ncbi:MAG: acyl-ACP--UDP-N-acetylglucosamine O-acyltransferase [Phycisphaerae bacterium]|nr:acyl-ACP--UDP-N-acetylglucosamine O-acyltransferase [Phycisphaerae bacterium]